MNLGVMRDNPGELAETRTCKTCVPYQTFGLHPVDREELQIFAAGVLSGLSLLERSFWEFDIGITQGRD